MRPYGLAVRRSGGQAGDWAGPGRRLNAKETGSREAIRHQFYAPGQETPGSEQEFWAEGLLLEIEEKPNKARVRAVSEASASSSTSRVTEVSTQSRLTQSDQLRDICGQGKFVDSVVGAEKRLKGLDKELQLITNIINLIAEQLILAECKAIFEDMGTIIDKIKSSGNFKWGFYFQNRKLEPLRARLNGLKV
ncbi:hypothetical protein N658DRAFT_488572 [Parathielavia hyrcaniae]|uniref:Uncharacterized protein n=1 Tax=Parathielavia hyrcaniae TaxID=113614 RepID=A0AAN6PUJ3_9PEZI|nr:hypothetical protein N658DRAFT_488572 [Parathielavia hyrcaniae]